MKLFLISAVSLAVTKADKTESYGREYQQRAADAEGVVRMESSTVAEENVSNMANLSGLDLVLASAMDQAVASTILPMASITNGFTQSAMALLGSMLTMRPNNIAPAAFYRIVGETINTFNNSNGRIVGAVPIDVFLHRLRQRLEKESFFDLERFHNVTRDVLKIVTLYPFVTTGSYFAYLAQVIATLEVMLGAVAPSPPAITIPLAPAVNPLPTFPPMTLPQGVIKIANWNEPAREFTGALNGGLFGLHAVINNALDSLPWLKPIIEPLSPIIPVPTVHEPFTGTWNPLPIPIKNSLQPSITGLNGLGSISALGAQALQSLWGKPLGEPILGGLIPSLFNSDGQMIHQTPLEMMTQSKIAFNNKMNNMMNTPPFEAMSALLHKLPTPFPDLYLPQSTIVNLPVVPGQGVGVVSSLAVDPIAEAEPVIMDPNWSLRDAAAFLLQRLDVVRPNHSSPQEFLLIINNVIRQLQHANSLENISPEEFLKMVVSAVGLEEVMHPEAVMSLGDHFRKSLDGPFPPFGKVLGHIGDVIEHKLVESN